jgi:uncharacterized protein YjdB
MATANDGSNVHGTLQITISNQSIPVTGITVTGEGGATLISSIGGTLQLNATIAPVNATVQTVTWAMINSSGQATINSTGLVTAVASGTVTARATANDGSSVSGSLVLTLSNQLIPVTGITIKGAGETTTITTDNGSLQLNAEVTPAYASNKTVTWSLSNGTGQASISSTGLVTAISSGTVTAIATANDGSGVNGTKIITIMRNINDPLIVIVNQNEMRFPIDNESYLNCKISIFNLYGDLMIAKQINSNVCTFDITLFRPGIYIVVLSDKMILKVAKVIIP